ncbi:GrlR family regulatory protein [Siccibacter colletis]|uniref:Negative regulator GrlR n=1 Tax=Siccibacter colletis TaxID=1505757 RepID=A0ABY6JCT9_9ENTR|nr:GrlR family regulatory protein [Siccibacter colletis]UYU30291.1 negative regulator GrlR [Siccibacter colletis]
MKNGIYKVIFDSNVNRNGNCDGIVTVRDDRLNGGDYVCYYQGVFDGNKISLKVVRHNPNDTTVFNGVDNVDLDLTLNELPGGTVFKGSVKGRPGLVIAGSMHYLSDII